MLFNEKCRVVVFVYEQIWRNDEISHEYSSSLVCVYVRILNNKIVFVRSSTYMSDGYYKCLLSSNRISFLENKIGYYAEEINLTIQIKWIAWTLNIFWETIMIFNGIDLLLGLRELLLSIQCCLKLFMTQNRNRRVTK